MNNIGLHFTFSCSQAPKGTRTKEDEIINEEDGKKIQHKDEKIKQQEGDERIKQSKTKVRRR